MSVAAGTLDKRVRIERLIGTVDSWGQPVETWQEVATVWANIRTLTGSSFITNELQAGGSEVSRTTASIRIRARSDIDHSMRVVHKERIYEIRSVLPVDSTYTDLACALGARAG